MDLNKIKIKFFNIVKLLMGHVQKNPGIVLIILFPHATCQHIYDCFRRYVYMNKWCTSILWTFLA